MKVKAAPGERQQQALAAIRVFEEQGKVWTTADLGRAIGVAHAQAYFLVDALFRLGHLQRGTRVVTVRDVPVLSERAA